MKQNKTLIKELRLDLHYHQMMVRVDLRADQEIRERHEVSETI